MTDTILPPLQSYELEFAAWFLEDAGADFEDRSDDEIFLPASSQALGIAAAIRAAFGDDAPEPGTCRIPGDDAELVQFYTSQAMGFFAERCRSLAASAEPVAFDAAELALMANLLELAAESHEEIAEDVSFDLTLDVTPANRLMFVSAVDQYMHRREAMGGRGKQAAETAIAIRAGVRRDPPEPTVDIPDYWLMFLLAHRCRELGKAGA